MLANADAVLTEITALTKNPQMIQFGDFIFSGDTRSAPVVKRGQEITEEWDNSTGEEATNALEQKAFKESKVVTKGGFTFPLFKQPKLIMDLVRGKDVH
jgi:hypothetical protein